MAKYAEKECAHCKELNCDKKFSGEYYHNKCFRKIKKQITHSVVRLK